MITISSGYYINVTIEGEREMKDWDIFIILNEPNNAPTSKEVGVIEEAVKKLVNANPLLNIDDVKMPSIIADKIESLNIGCVQYGIQVIIK